MGIGVEGKDVKRLQVDYSKALISDKKGKKAEIFLPKSRT